MRTMTKATPVVLLWGEDPFLLRERALELLDGVRPVEVDAAGWTGSELQDLATPSLFGEKRALMVTDARSLPKEALSDLGSYLSAPDPGAPLIICCVVAERGKPPAALHKLVEPAGRIEQVQVKRKDLEPWVLARAKSAGLDLTPQGARALVATVGEDAAQLAASVQQLASAFPGRKIGPLEVHGQFRGLGEQRTWDLCDKAFGKDLPGAIRALRSIEEGGDDPLMVLGAIAARLRDLMKVRSLPDRIPMAELAKRAGLRFEWQARRYAQQARNFSMEDLVLLHSRVTQADRALKSGATGDWIMPSLIVSIAA
jgi:DNA polymerase-3 subunit delta